MLGTLRPRGVKPGTSGYWPGVTSARDDQASARGTAAQGDAALGLAAELSDRALREAETARRIAEMLAAQPAVCELPPPPSRQVDDRLTIGCSTCEVTLTPPLRDPDE